MVLVLRTLGKNVFSWLVWYLWDRYSPRTFQLLALVFLGPQGWTTVLTDILLKNRIISTKNSLTVAIMKLIWHHKSERVYLSTKISKNHQFLRKITLLPLRYCIGYVYSRWYRNNSNGQVVDSIQRILSNSVCLPKYIVTEHIED